jgi:hypothetical protein
MTLSGVLLGMLQSEIVCDGSQFLGIRFCQGRARASLTASMVVVSVVGVGSKTQPRFLQRIIVPW